MRERDRDAARALRKAGWSLREIAHHLGVSLGRTSEWVRDIPREERPATPDDALLTEPLPIWNSGRVQTCGRCGFVLPLELFNARGAGWQWWCRRCFSAYQRDRRPTNRARALRRIDAARAFILGYLAAHPCADCEQADPVVLEFDHVASKRELISALVNRGAPLARITAELANCEVVCVNCHRRRSARRGGSRRLGADFKESQTRPVRNRNFRHLFAVLVERGCIDCGERDLVVLDFDHIDGKTASVSQLAHRECSLARLDEEIAKCDVRCANCHRRKTAIDFGYYRASAG